MLNLKLIALEVVEEYHHYKQFGADLSNACDIVFYDYFEDDDDPTDEIYNEILKIANELLKEGK